MQGNPYSADPTWSAGQVFVGRTVERETMITAIRTLPAAGMAMILSGEAGGGKSALLRQVAGSVPGVRACWVRGVESEMALPFAAAAELLKPLQPFFDHLPNVQKSAPEVSLALAAGNPPSPLAVCAAALGVLSMAAADMPLLVIVDDFQWVDEPSQQLLMFIARRLESEQIGMILATREHARKSCPDLSTIQLAGLTRDECEMMLTGHGLQIPAQLLTSVVELSAGNPLAVIEIVRELKRQSASLSIDDPLWIGSNLTEVWESKISNLPIATQRSLFVVAAARNPTVSLIDTVLTKIGLTLKRYCRRRRTSPCLSGPKRADVAASVASLYYNKPYACICKTVDIPGVCRVFRRSRARMVSSCSERWT